MAWNSYQSKAHENLRQEWFDSRLSSLACSPSVMNRTTTRMAWHGKGVLLISTFHGHLVGEHPRVHRKKPKQPTQQQKESRKYIYNHIHLRIYSLYQSSCFSSLSQRFAWCSPLLAIDQFNGKHRGTVSTKRPHAFDAAMHQLWTLPLTSPRATRMISNTTIMKVDTP